MRQFYQYLADPDNYTVVIFKKPVRKICIESNGDIFIRLDFSGDEKSVEFRIYAKTPTYLDFQSANNGGGVSGFSVRASKESGSNAVYVSVGEYATGGDIDWYK